MARPAIIRKLDRQLQESIISEQQVVYLLVEIRKLIEIDQEGTKYRTLKFCSDWAVHPVLAGVVAQEIVQQFDSFQAFIEEMAGAKHGDQVTNRLPEGLDETLRLSDFRNELGGYLRQHNLNSSVADDDQKWVSFLTAYGRVIEECPLRCVGRNLKYTDEVVLRVVQVRSEPSVDLGGAQLVIEWSWKSKITGIESKNQQFY